MHTLVIRDEEWKYKEEPVVNGTTLRVELQDYSDEFNYTLKTTKEKLDYVMTYLAVKYHGEPFLDEWDNEEKQEYLNDFLEENYRYRYILDEIKKRTGVEKIKVRFGRGVKDAYVLFDHQTAPDPLYRGNPLDELSDDEIVDFIFNPKVALVLERD